MHRRRYIRAAVVLGLVWGLVVLTGQPAAALTAAPDQTWRTNKNDKVFALARSASKVYVGGQITKVFDAAGNFVRNASALIAVDATTGAVIPTFDARITNTTLTAPPRVTALALSADGSTLYVGGRFDTVGGQPRSNLAAVNAATGALIGAVDLNVSNAVRSILVGPDKVYLGGDFKRVNGRARGYLAAMAFDGTLDATWIPTAGDGGTGTGVSIRSLEFSTDGATIFVGGQLQTMNGAARRAVARVTSDTGALHPWAIPAAEFGTNNVAWDLLVTPTRLYGGFGNPNFAGAFRLDNGDVGTRLWKFGASGNVQGVALHPNGTRLFVSGHFGTAGAQTVCGGQSLRGLMMLNTATGQIDCSWIPQVEPFGTNFHGVWPLVVSPTQLWIGGKITRISGVTASGFARYTL